MDYKEFIENVKEQIRDYLPERCADAEITVGQVVKNNDSIMDTLHIRTQESNASPAIYLNYYYEQIKEGAELKDVLSMIADVYEENHFDHEVDISAIMNYDSIRDKIVCKLINKEANEQFLEDKPYTQIEDLAVVYQVLAGQDEKSTSTLTISDRLMEMYGVTTEELHEQAISNMESLQPHSFKGMNETMIEMFAADLAEKQGIDMESAMEMASRMVPEIPDTMYVLTNSTKINGASEILRDDVMQEISDKVGDFFVLPSSVHETLIIPKSSGMERGELEQMVREVNRTQVMPEERLSDHVYEYDAEEHRLMRSDRAGERVKQNEKREEGRNKRPSLKDKLAEKQAEAAGSREGGIQNHKEKKKEATI